MSEEEILRAKTATLTRMLNLQGTIGMFGHVSIRMPGTDKCFISPGASTDKTTVRPEQIFTYNIDGTIIDDLDRDVRPRLDPHAGHRQVFHQSRRQHRQNHGPP